MTSTSTDRIKAASSSRAIKAPCAAATTAAITLSGEQTIDGIAVVSEDRVLVKNQASSVDNGIYIADTGTWARAPDANGNADWTAGTLVKVNGGAVAQGFWYLSTTGDITVGTTAITFGMASTVLAVFSPFAQTLMAAADASAARVILSAAALGDIASSGLLSNTGKLLCRLTAGIGSIEEKSLNEFTEDTAPDTAADFLMSYDTSAAAMKKVGPYRLRSTTALVRAATDNTTFITPANLYAAIGFANFYESAQQAITAAGVLTLAHGLTRAPLFVALFLVCQTGELGYTAGAVVGVSYNADINSAANRGIGVDVDATNINIKYGSDANIFAIINKTTGAAGAITAGNWKLLVRVWG